MGSEQVVMVMVMTVQNGLIWNWEKKLFLGKVLK